MKVRSHAKINWALRITGRRADGFHDLETLFQAISLHDDLTFEPAARLSLTCDDPLIPVDDTNLVIRAARALGSPPVAIDLRKRIPSGGGLGGGSSNAAATLMALDAMFELKTSRVRMHEIALQLGSDVPFFLDGGTAYATGRGEALTPLAAPSSEIALLLLIPEERVSTREAFARITRYSKPAGIAAFRTALTTDFLAHADLLVNDFEEPIFAMLPRLGELKRRLLEAGAAWAGMSGSGSTIAGAFRDARSRDEAERAFDDVFGVRRVAAAF
ncbi:MAG: 4-(cytidine 5'-diphospho)-2-C-methyl-D-erythritol kinase [Thermoanaerobaculia bacterium]|nr:4-(cytidine 5'-diphospho)-2-C-methyl-D-erythritol kinase [Thermoanaerobaculia bacterium]